MAQKTVVIVGGGICGLMAATVLQCQGLEVIVLDKGRGIGGRLATRRLRHGDIEGCFDFGTQYFKALDPTFKHWVEGWIEAGVVEVWSRKMPSASGVPKSTSVVLYRGIPGNRSLAQYLAQSLTVETKTRVSHFEWQDERWHIHCESGATYLADYLVLTPPVPQSLDLMSASNLLPFLPKGLHSTLSSIQYEACLTLLILLDSVPAIPEPGGIWLSGEPLRWLACNHQKGASPDGYGVTAHAGPAFSRTFFDSDRQKVTELMLAAAEPWLEANVLETYLHGWRYSQPLNFYDESFAFGHFPGPLYFGGDAFMDGKVEGAALSGLAIAKHLISQVI